MPIAKAPNPNFRQLLNSKFIHLTVSHWIAREEGDASGRCQSEAVIKITVGVVIVPVER